MAKTGISTCSRSWAIFWGSAGPFKSGDGISRGIVFQQDFDGVDYFDVFFSVRWRPPPLCEPQRGLHPDEELLSSASYGMRVQIKKLGQLMIPAMPSLRIPVRHRADAAVRRAGYKTGGSRLLVRPEKSPVATHSPGWERTGRCGVPGLSAAADRIDEAIEKQAGHQLPCYPALLDEVIQRVRTSTCRHSASSSAK